MRTLRATLVLSALLIAAPIDAAVQVAPAAKPGATRRHEPRLVATVGPSGTERVLEDGALLSLGAAPVGGANDGTLLRVANAGEFPLRLGAPELEGLAAGDFDVDVEGAAFPLGAALPLEVRAAPFRVARAAAATGGAAGGPGVAFELDAAALARDAGLREVAWTGVPLPGLGPVTLALRRRELPIAADSKLVVDGRELAGGIAPLAEGLHAWSGAVVGLDGASAFLVLDALGAWGWVELPAALGGRVLVAGDGPGRARLVRERDLAASPEPAPRCEGELFPPGRVPPSAAPVPGTSPRLTIQDCRIALETDWQLRQKFATTPDLVRYVVGLVAAASERYLVDVQCTLSIAYLGVHATANDGWTSQDGGFAGFALLEEFRTTWGTAWAPFAEAAHFLSGAPGGGIAYIGVLCNAEFGFGLTAGVEGSIDWSGWTGSPGPFRDFSLFAHELGHQFRAIHTHEYCPPLDRCHTNCDGIFECPRGTIMSYCDVCPGGHSNLDLVFHPVSAESMREHVNATCVPSARLAPGDFVQWRVRFAPLFTPGRRIARLGLAHDAPNAGTPFRVGVTGRGL